MRSAAAAATIDASSFYGEYSGHKVDHLKALLPLLRSSSDGIFWTAGDSSLDNKYWFEDKKEAVGAYAQILNPPLSICDITYWLNYLAQQRQSANGWKWAAINTAVEATTLEQRSSCGLLPQDEFIRDNIQPNDVLVVSIGGNDVALSPTIYTILSMATLIYLPAFFESVAFKHFRCLFGTQIQTYIENLTATTKPKKILICMIYYPDEAQTNSWANLALGAMGYNSNPIKLQMLIRKIFVEAICHIHIPGIEVIPVPLFDVLDGKNTADYVDRVEPSAIGGKKMAEFLLGFVYDSSNMQLENQ